MQKRKNKGQARGHVSMKPDINSARIGKPDGEREWLGLRHLAEYSDTSERTLRGWVHSPVDPLPAVRIGGKILIRRRDFDSWAQRHKITPCPSGEIDKIVGEVMEGIIER